MKGRDLALLIVILFGCAIFEPAFAADPSTVSDDTVVARAGQTSYTLADIRKRLERLEPPYRYAAEQEISSFVRDFVQRQALAQEGLRLGLEHDPEVRAEIAEATQAILIRALFKHEVVAHAMPTPEAVAAYYREHPDEFRIPEQAEVDQVVVPNEQKGLAIRTAVLGGQSLAAAAQGQGVDRVDVATFPRGMREPEVEQAVFALAVGEMSQPVRTSEGVFLFRLRARYEAHLKPLETVTSSIQAQLAAQNQQRLWKELQGRLWSPDNMIVRDDLLKAPIPSARSADSGEQAYPKNAPAQAHSKKP